MGKWVLVRLSQIVSNADGIPEFDCLVTTCRDKQLALAHVDNINDACIMGRELTRERHVPRWVACELSNHVLLQIPHKNLALVAVARAEVSFGILSVGSLPNRLYFVTWDRFGVCCSWQISNILWHFVAGVVLLSRN